MVKVIKSLAFVLFACCAVALFSGIHSSAEAGKRYKRIYTLSEIVARMKQTGFYNIRVTDRHPPYYDFDACYKGKEYELTVDYKGNVKDKDYEGRCRYRLKQTSGVSDAK